MEQIIILDHHPNDCRTNIAEDQQAVQTLTSRMGTGGGNVPLILEPITYDAQVTNPLHKDNTQGGVCHTLNCDSRNYVVIPLEGNGARPSHHGDGYRKSDPMYTLNTIEVHSIAYAFEPGILKREGKENRVCKEITPTIREHMGDNQTAVAYDLAVEQTKYIVRRLTPTECARLQGFPDWWCSDIPHTDSQEYRLWGNGVALPCVLYVMEGIAEVLKNEKGEKK